MRTTINIDEHLLAQAKDDARAAGITLGQYVEQAIRRHRERRSAEADAPLPVHHGALLVPIDKMSNAELFDYLDEGEPAEKLH